MRHLKLNEYWAYLHIAPLLNPIGLTSTTITLFRTVVSAVWGRGSLADNIITRGNFYPCQQNPSLPWELSHLLFEVYN